MCGKNACHVWCLTGCFFFALTLSLSAFPAAPTFTPTSTATPGPAFQLVNGGLDSTGDTPTGWGLWGWDYSKCNTVTAYCRGGVGTSWDFWWDAGLYQDVTAGFSIGDRIRFGSYLYTPNWDHFRDGAKHARVDIEFRTADPGSTTISIVSASPLVNAASPGDVWILAQGEETVPAGTEMIRLVIRMGDPSPGDGRFYADDAFVVNVSLTPSPTPSFTITPTAALSPGRRGAATPNPFLPSRGQTVDFHYVPAAPAVIRIVDIKGRRMRTLNDVSSWDGRDDSGRPCEGGVYFYQIECGSERISGKVVLIR